MALSRYIQFEKQTTYTDETFGSFGINAHLIDPVGESITADHGYIYPRTAGQRAKRPRVTGGKTFSGTIDTPLYPVHATSLLYYALGEVTTAVGNPTQTNVHTIKPAKSIPFFRAAIGRDIKEHRYVGGIINGVTIDYNPTELLTASFDVILRRELSTLGTLNTDLSFTSFDTDEAPFGGVEVMPTINTTPVTYIESASISIENNVYGDAFALSSPYLPAGMIAELAVTGSMDLRYDSSDTYTDWLYEPQVELKLVASRGIGNTTRKITVEFASLAYDTNELPTDNIERYVQTVNFTAEPLEGDPPIVIYVQNTQSNAQFSG